MKKLILTILATSIILSSGYFISTAYANDPENKASATDQALDNLGDLEKKLTGQDPSEDPERLEYAIAGIIEAVFSVIVVILLILIGYSGILWMTARGNDEQVERARKYISNSIIGLIIIFAAYSITVFLIQQLSSAVFRSNFSF